MACRHSRCTDNRCHIIVCSVHSCCIVAAATCVSGFSKMAAKSRSDIARPTNMSLAVPGAQQYSSTAVVQQLCRWGAWCSCAFRTLNWKVFTHTQTREKQQQQPTTTATKQHSVPPGLAILLTGQTQTANATQHYFYAMPERDARHPRQEKEMQARRHRQKATLTWSTGFKFDALRRVPAEASAAGLLAPAPNRAIVLPVEAIVHPISQACYSSYFAICLAPTPLHPPPPQHDFMHEAPWRTKREGEPQPRPCR